MLTTTYEMLQKAYEGHYAVPAINTQGGTYDIIRAVCMAAEELRSPVILAHYVNTGAYSGHDWFYETAKWMAGKVSVPVAIHLDHGDSFERCMEMLKLGFTSIMFDGSALPVEENAAAPSQKSATWPQKWTCFPEFTVQACLPADRHRYSTPAPWLLCPRLRN